MDELTREDKKSARKAPPSAGAFFARTEDADATLGTSRKGKFYYYFRSLQIVVLTKVAKT